MKKYLILIPSCGELSPVMHAETGFKFPIYIQIGQSPLYHHILRSYSHIKDVSKFIFLIPKNSHKLNLNDFNEFDVETLELDSSESISQTIFFGLEKAKGEQTLIIHMGDTIISPIASELADAVYTKSRDDLYRWTCISKDLNNKSLILVDRDVDTFGELKQVCVGVFVFSDLSLFFSILNSELVLKSNKSEVFFEALHFYSIKREMQIVEPDIWHDFGHLDTYYESRLNFHNLRFFNSLTYDSELGLVTKKSNNINAFRHQVRWFKQVPDEFSWFLPRIFDSNDGEVPFITMELLTIPTLNEMFITNRLEIGAWDNIAKKVSGILNSFVKYKHDSSTVNYLAKEMYLVKTKKRILEFLAQNNWANDLFVEMFDKKFTLLSVLNDLENYIEKFRLLNVSNFVPIHGDLCFSNILYDLRSNQIKFIDPRGEFGIPGIFGDQLYDKAKLMHSYLGFYDFILSGDFRVNIIFNELRSNFTLPLNYSKINKIFSNRLFADKVEEEKCNAIMSLLFLSMLPLHSDNVERQMTMLYVGLSTFAKNYQKELKWQ